jgi:hypothetical protein
MMQLSRIIAFLLATLSLCSATAFLSKTRLASLINTLGEKFPAKQKECSFDHSGFDALLKKHVKKPTMVNGILSTLFDYKAVLDSAGDATVLHNYIQSLVAFDPTCLQSNDKLAFWINAYNAVIINLVLSGARDASGVLPKSIKDLAGNASAVWDRQACIVNVTAMTLEDVLIAASRLKDPRIHAAVNCASLSCPDLRAGAYSAENIQLELDMQVKDWLANPTKGVQATNNKLKVSPIFDWHAKDFPSLSSFLAAFLEKPLDSMEVSGYLSYEWSLNTVT